MPVAAGRHSRTLDQNDYVGCHVGIAQSTSVAIQVIVCDVDYAGVRRSIRAHNQPLHLSEQYFTLGQSRAHFLRHSNGSPQRAQILGSKPFLVFASRGMGFATRTKRALFHQPVR
jgi:hypothetical protein